MRCYIFDIDGTLADCSHRIHHIQKSPKDWRSFFAAVEFDAPIVHVIKLAIDLSLAGAAIIYVSGRSDECRAATESWLRQYACPHGRLYMRKEGDYRDDDIVKAEILGELQQHGYNPIMAFDDRNRVVAAWRRNGVPCAQVAEGDFLMAKVTTDHMSWHGACVLAERIMAYWKSRGIVVKASAQAIPGMQDTFGVQSNAGTLTAANIRAAAQWTRAT
jgi:hypothetical protein